MRLNDFRLIIDETPKTVVAIALKTKEVTGDGHQGTQDPRLAFDALSDPDLMVRAKKHSAEGGIEFRSGPLRCRAQKHFTIWDGAPKGFDYLD